MSPAGVLGDKRGGFGLEIGQVGVFVRIAIGFFYLLAGRLRAEWHLNCSRFFEKKIGC